MNNLVNKIQFISRYYNVWLLIFGIFIGVSSYGQSLIGNAGKTFENSIGKMDWSLGEAVIYDLQNNSNTLFQGFQFANQLSLSILKNKDSICAGSSLSLSAISTGGSPNHSYQWTSNPTGYSSFSKNIVVSPIISTWYIVEVSDGGLCPNLKDSVFIKVNPSQFNLAFSATQTTFSNPPFYVVIQNQTPNPSQYYWQWNMGDGNLFTTINPMHTYLYNGDYNVNVSAKHIITGCIDTLTKNNYIHCTTGGTNPCTLVATIHPAAQALICSNDSIKLTTNQYPNTTYKWIKNANIIPGATDSFYYAKEAGMYQVMISNSQCSVFSSFFTLINYPSNNPIIISNGTITPCINNSLQLTVNQYFSSYLWNTGDTTQSIYVKNSGQYSVSIIDNYGCHFPSAPISVNASLLAPPDICIVGVDSATNNNRIIWQRYNSNIIDSFKIYRETSISNQYQLIGSTLYNQSSFFIDQNSNPSQQSYRYKISAVDSCGAETTLSDFHKTIHLTINAGLGNTWNLIWNSYEGFSFNSYNIYRGGDSINLQLLTQIQSTMNSYTDLNPPAGKVYYQIEVKAPTSCYPDSLLKANTNYNTSRSNTVKAIINPYISSAKSNNNLNVQIFPNPNKGLFTVLIQNSDYHDFKDLKIEIISSIGVKLVSYNLDYQPSKFSQNIDLQSLSKGVYFLRVTDSDKSKIIRFEIN